MIDNPLDFQIPTVPLLYPSKTIYTYMNKNVKEAFYSHHYIYIATSQVPCSSGAGNIEEQRG